MSTLTRPARTARTRLRDRGSRGGALRVHLGCGATRLPGWLNTDVSWRAGHYLDASRPWPITSPVEAVYADNVVEHFSLDNARRVFRHAFDAMAPGAVIRLATPDVEAIARIYLGEAGAEAIDACVSHDRASGYALEHRVDLLRVTFTAAGHHLGYLFDFDSLRAELLDAGFIDVQRKQPGHSAYPHLRNLERRTAPAEVARALVVEARRP